MFRRFHLSIDFIIFTALIFTAPVKVFAGPLDRWNFAMVAADAPSENSLDLYSENYTIPAFGPWGIPHELMSFDRPLQQVFNEIHSREMMIVVDCSLFVQIAALALNGKLGQPGARLFAMGSADPDSLPRFFNRTFAYVSPADDAASEKLQDTHYLAKGHWLLKVGPDRYLGLSLTGASYKTQSASAWLKETKTALFQQMKEDEQHVAGCDQDLIGLTRREVDLRVSFGGTRFFRDNGRLEAWKLTEFAP